MIPPLGLIPPPSNVEIPPNQVANQPVNHASLLGHGLPHRPELRPSPRNPNPPIRTWSAGTLDLPMRPIDGLPIPGRPDGVIRDKRRSVAGLMRRDSSGLGFGTQGDQWINNSPRDNGPVASKWEHLPLAPDLLRSLNKFGVGPPNKIQQRALPFLLRGSDIIAQAPPTQERIAAYVIPAIHVAVTQIAARPIHRGPVVVMISTTVDQATQAQRMIRDIGGPIGIRSALGVGTAGSTNDVAQELNLLQQNLPHIICGTPQKLHALFTTPGGLIGSDVRFLVLDEVDQLIARNLHEFVFSIVKLLPPPRSRSGGTPGTSPSSAGTTPAPFNPLDVNGSGLGSPFQNQNNGRRFSAMSISSNSISSGSVTPPPANSVERQTALFSNTVPQDVLNLANAIQLREPVRVLVRRDGNVAQSETGQGTKGLRQFYLYLAFAPGSRPDASPAGPGAGHGIIGSGRGASSAETAQAREWKLDALADLLDDLEVPQIIVHVGGMVSLDAVVYKLASKGLEAVPLHSDMNAGAKLAALNKFRASSGSMIRPAVPRVLVIYDVQVKSPDVTQVPLVINYDLPQAVEEYSHRVAPAIATNYSRAGVVVNFVTAAGGDVEMLRSIECFYK
ncbi:P-loop containing nucleoside triphosphate hydrolase protein [Schizopora paradoxa]|uniref:RNA helicase n=1 Tax=Schizopora paradoxa TaxID=27342 RepID=A0A0H2RWX1_9AGAM|nr:P-loop containing nucleoside triphosphate hydrolase protein [Schizopora paradoxa]